MSKMHTWAHIGRSWFVVFFFFIHNWLEEEPLKEYYILRGHVRKVEGGGVKISAKKK